MLHNDFYTTHDIQQSDNQYSCRIVFNADHDIFSGHFPGHPVVPGVCMMEMVKELTQGVLNQSLVLSVAGNVKFLQLITPDIQPHITIGWKEHEGNYKINASFKLETGILFKMDGVYAIVA